MEIAAKQSKRITKVFFQVLAYSEKIDTNASDSQICKNRSFCLPQNEEMDGLGLKTLLTLWKILFFSKKLNNNRYNSYFLPSRLETFLSRVIKRKNKYDNSATIKIKSRKIKAMFKDVET